MKPNQYCHRKRIQVALASINVKEKPAAEARRRRGKTKVFKRIF